MRFCLVCCLLWCAISWVHSAALETTTTDYPFNATTIKHGICPKSNSGRQQQSGLDCSNETLSECTSDGDCDDDQKCCFDGCNSSCVYPIFTGCQQLSFLLGRQASLSDETKNMFVPKCKESGEFEDVQCDETTKKCWCVDDIGFELAGTRESSRDLVNCSDSRPCADVLCRMLCPYGFELDSEGCPLCKCRNPCAGVECPADQECQLEEIPCAEDICPPLPTCKQPRSLDGLCPMGTPLSSPDSGSPFLCGMETNKPQCPPTYLCDVMPGNDYGVCCPLVDKPGQCPTELLENESCGQDCEMDMDCGDTSKCCSIDSCGKVCSKPANITLCLQQKAVVELLLSSNPGYEGYIPQCLENGAFSPKQCSVNGHLCWCVATNGTIIVGTMGLADGVKCEEQQERTEDDVEAHNIFQCEELACEKECENGYKYNGRGCRTCECAEPCQDIACPYGLECVLLKVDNCLGEYCPPVPTCKDTNTLCNWGKALYKNNTDILAKCEECPETHQCENSHQKGICCPKKIAIEVTKPEECPYHIKEPEVCEFICTSDSDCEGKFKCCHSKRCGAICVPPQPPRPPTMCEYLRETGMELEQSGRNVSLAVAIPQCLPDGAFGPMQCSDSGDCWCVDEFGVEIIKTRTADQSLDCLRIREEMSCLGLICRLGCDFGFVMDDEGCPLCSCRNPCQNSSCDPDESCQFMEVNCKDDWCPPLPHCVPLKTSARNLPECSVGSPMLYEDDNEPVMCDPFSSYPQCPSTHDCVVSNPSELGVCCPRVSEISENEATSFPPAFQNKQGQCPYLIPTQADSCDYQCSSDDDCAEDEKCCSNGCGTQCTKPVLKTSCQHQRAAAEHRTRELGIPASRAYLPNCTDDGDFSAIQCHPISKQCWCVDGAGLEIPGTRVKEQKLITCIPEVEQCSTLHCDLFCPNGYQIDSNNCPVCSCYNPCEGFKCKNSDESCRLVQVSCITDPCPPMPLCLPKLENPCPIGEPLYNDDGSLVHCGPVGDQCPNSHRCYLSPLGEYALCCPKPTPTSCEVLKKRNLNFHSINNRITFLPKCNKKTGAWDPTQCMKSLGLCWCVDSDGNQLPGTLIRGVPHCTARSGKSMEDTPICENGKPVHICPETLCEGKICLAHPNATCQVNPCGGCSPQFIDDYNHPIDCNEGLTACFAEVQDMVNNRLPQTPLFHDNAYPMESREDLEEMSVLPPPLYPPPPPPPHLALDFNHHRILIDYDYDESQRVRDYDTYDPHLEDYGTHDMSAMHSMDYPVIMPPKIERVQIKMTARTAPFMHAMEIEPLIEVIASQPKYQVLGISRRFTIVDHADSSLLTKPGMCPAPSLLSILHSIARGCVDQCLTDLDCPGFAKCCLYNCGMSCVEPLLPAAIERSSAKSGNCPSSDVINPLMCLFSSRECSSDEDCSGERKCCMTICGQQCVNTIEERKELLFKPVKMQIALPKCSPEGGYAVTQQQGELSWCVDHFGNPFHHTLTRGKVECLINGTIIYQKKTGPVCHTPNEIPQVCRKECMEATCASNPEAVCVADPCNHCSVSFVSSDGSPVNCQEKCKQPLVVGNCRSSLPRYYFNKNRNKCVRFTYGGCQGNANNFESLELCKEECEKNVPQCEQPKEIGLCRAQMFRWSYNKATHRCEKFMYGGCGGNENNFETIEECERTCPDLVICPWTNVNGDTLVPCSKSAACKNVSCPGRTDVQCVVDPCSCKAEFVDRNGDPVTCSKTPIPTPEETSFLRTASLAQYTRCESLLKRHKASDSMYIPQCNEMGEFYPVQCAQVKEPESQCWCVDEAGMQLPSTTTFPKGNKTCKFVKVKRVEVTLVFKHDDPVYSRTMAPSMKRLVSQFLRDLKAETSEVSINVLPDATHVMFSLLSDNKVQVAFKLEEMVRIQGIYIVFPKAEMPVDYRASHFYHILDYEAEAEEDNSVIASHIGGVGSDQDRSWTRFLLYTVIGSFTFLLLIYVIPLIIHKRRQKKGEEKSKSSLVSMVFNNITYGIIGKKSEEKTIASDVPNVVVQTVEAQYESLQKEKEAEKALEVSETSPTYDNIEEKDQSEKSEKH